MNKFSELESIIKYSECGYRFTVTIPTFGYTVCGERIKPQQEDCCVYCSYGSVPCPPVQQNEICC